MRRTLSAAFFVYSHLGIAEINLFTLLSGLGRSQCEAGISSA
jgi:hypothetical protein